MNQMLARLAVGFCLVGISLLCFRHFACNTAATNDQGPRLLPTAVGDYVDEVVAADDLQARVESNHRRVQEKYHVVTDLLAGRLTLKAAAARFQELDADVPGIRDQMAQRHPGISAGEAWCREVIEHARSVLRVRDPEQVEHVVGRLDAELRASMKAEVDSRQR